MARRFAKVSEEEIEEAFFYPSDLVNIKTTIPLRVILVQYCRTDTTREWLDTTRTTRTTRTGRETMVYGLYRSWINDDMHIISNTARKPRRYDPYESYDSYGS